MSSRCPTFSRSAGASFLALLLALLAALVPLAAAAEEVVPPRFDLDCDRVLVVQVRPYLGQFAVFVEMPPDVAREFQSLSKANRGRSARITVRGHPLFSHTLYDTMLYNATAFLFHSGARAMEVGIGICKEKLRVDEPLWLYRTPAVVRPEEREFEFNCDRVAMVHVHALGSGHVVYLEVPGEVDREFLHASLLQRGEPLWITAQGHRLFRHDGGVANMNGTISFSFATMEAALQAGEAICPRKLAVGNPDWWVPRSQALAQWYLRQREAQQLLPSPYQGARLLH